MVARGWGKEQERGGLEFVTSRCRLLYIEWINNKVLLYSIGKYIHIVINHDEKEF